MLAYERKGQGAPVVLLHAFPLSSAMWREQIEFLQKYVCVIAPDLPGFGKSARQAKPSISGMALEVKELLDYLKIDEPVWLGGLSMGGYVAFEFLRQFPELVSGLGLFSTRAAADTPEGREKRSKAIEFIRTQGMESFLKTALPNLLGKTTLEKHPEIVRKVREMALANDPEGVCDSLTAMADRRDSSDLLCNISMPVLIISGDEDQFIPAAETRAMQEAVSFSQMKVLPGAGHLANLESPEFFSSTLKDFISAAKYF